MTKKLRPEKKLMMNFSKQARKLLLELLLQMKLDSESFMRREKLPSLVSKLTLLESMKLRDKEEELLLMQEETSLMKSGLLTCQNITSPDILVLRMMLKMKMRIREKKIMKIRNKVVMMEKKVRMTMMTLLEFRMMICMLMRMLKPTLKKNKMITRRMEEKKEQKKEKVTLMHQKMLMKNNNNQLNHLLNQKSQNLLISIRPVSELTHHLPLMERNLLRKPRKL